MKLPLCLGIAFSLWATFASAETLTERATQLAQAVLSVEKPDAGQIAKYAEAWNHLCEQKKPGANCYLTETSVLGAKGRPGYVLLFRGEAAKNSLPATSGFLRQVLSGDLSLCNGQCTFEELESQLRLTVTELLTHSIDLMRSTTLIFDDSHKIWNATLAPNIAGQCGAAFESVHPIAEIEKCAPAHGSDQQEFDDSLKKMTPLSFLIQVHLSSSDIATVQAAQGPAKKMDVATSYSESPEKAKSFAGPTGRVIVVSVPKSKIRAHPKLDCKDLNFKADELIDAAICGYPADGDYNDEKEVDYLFLTNPKDIVNVLNL